MNEKGVTLIEVLAGIVVSTIIIGAIYGVLVNSFNNYADIKQKVDLQQQATIIVETLRNYHRDHQQYELSYNVSNQKVYITQNGSSQLLGNEEVAVEIDAGPTSPTEFTSLVVDTMDPLYISLKLIYRDEEYGLDTIINRY